MAARTLIAHKGLCRLCQVFDYNLRDHARHRICQKHVLDIAHVIGVQIRVEAMEKLVRSSHGLINLINGQPIWKVGLSIHILRL